MVGWTNPDAQMIFSYDRLISSFQEAPSEPQGRSFVLYGLILGGDHSFLV
jgi:hypothetical protein